jgi:IclR family transcriptional regulator, KDG regulon repressor
MMKNPVVEDQTGNRYNIRVLDRAFHILALLSDGKPRTLQELSGEIDLSTSTTFRQLATLVQHRYVQRDEQTNQYTLGLSCLELARAYNEGNDLRRAALPELERLRNETKETVHLAILDQMEIVYIEKLQGLYTIGFMGSRVGGRSPAYCTGVGKVLLAYTDPRVIRRYFLRRKLQRYTDNTITSFAALVSELASIRSQGYALDHGEHEFEVCCVAAPIFDMKGDVIGGLSISGPVDRLEPIERNRDLIEKAKQTANNISVKLGYSSLK